MYYVPLVKPTELEVSGQMGNKAKIPYSQAQFFDEFVWVDARWRQDGDRAELWTNAVDRFEQAVAESAVCVEFNDDQRKVMADIVSSIQLPPQVARQVRKYVHAILRASTTPPDSWKRPNDAAKALSETMTTDAS